MLDCFLAGSCNAMILIFPKALGYLFQFREKDASSAKYGFIIYNLNRIMEL